LDSFARGTLCRFCHDLAVHLKSVHAPCTISTTYFKVVAAMSKLQRSSTKQEDDDDDLASVDSWDSQTPGRGDGLVGDDDICSISIRSDIRTPHGLSTKQMAAKQERSTLAAQETRAIFCLRLVVLLTLMIFGVTFALALFTYTNATQEQDFEEQFGFYRDQVIEKFNRQLERTLNAMDTLSTEMTSHALSSGSEFPFVTFPDFEFRGANARISGDAVAIFYMPYITEDMIAPWEKYAAANQGYKDTALDSEQKSNVEQDKLFGLTPPKINGLAGEYLEFLEALNGTSIIETSKLWTSVMDGKEHVSVALFCLDRRLRPNALLTYIIRDSRNLPTSHFGNIPHRYRLKRSILTWVGTTFYAGV